MSRARRRWWWVLHGALSISACGGGRVPEDVLSLVKNGGPEARLELMTSADGAITSWAGRGLKPEQAPSAIAERGRAYYADGELVAYELVKSRSGEATHEMVARQPSGQLCRVAFNGSGERVWAECAFAVDTVPEAVQRGLGRALQGGTAGAILVRRTVEGESASVRAERNGRVERLAVDATGATEVTHSELPAVLLVAE